MEEKLSYEEQVQRLKAVYGIKFSLMSEPEAISFLTHHNYYAKLRSYIGSFPKEEGEEKRCIDTDFKHLHSLSLIDMHLRKAILPLCLDLEHSMKNFFIHHLTEDRDSNGYALVDEFEGYLPRGYSGLIASAKKNEYIRSIAERFERELSIWNLIELLNFTDFRQLLRIYSMERDGEFDFEVLLMKAARNLRNVAAHNGTLLHDLQGESGHHHRQIGDLSFYLKNTLRLPEEQTQLLMEVPALHELSASLVLISLRATKGIKRKRYEELRNFLSICAYYKELYQPHTRLISYYKALEALADELESRIDW